jgi:hypothetical protein
MPWWPAVERLDCSIIIGLLVCVLHHRRSFVGVCVNRSVRYQSSPFSLIKNERSLAYFVWCQTFFKISKNSKNPNCQFPAREDHEEESAPGVLRNSTGPSTFDVEWLVVKSCNRTLKKDHRLSQIACQVATVWYQRKRQNGLPSREWLKLFKNPVYVCELLNTSYVIMQCSISLRKPRYLMHMFFFKLGKSSFSSLRAILSRIRPPERRACSINLFTTSTTCTGKKMYTALFA